MSSYSLLVYYLLVFCSGSKLWGARKRDFAFHRGLPNPRPRAEQQEYRWGHPETVGRSHGKNLKITQLQFEFNKRKIFTCTDQTLFFCLRRHSLMTPIPLCAATPSWVSVRSWQSAGSCSLLQSSQTSWRSLWWSWQLTAAPLMSAAQSSR